MIERSRRRLPRGNALLGIAGGSSWGAFLFRSHPCFHQSGRPLSATVCRPSLGRCPMASKLLGANWLAQFFEYLEGSVATHPKPVVRDAYKCPVVLALLRRLRPPRSFPPAE